MQDFQDFLAEIRSRPEFIAAAKTDQSWLAQLDNIEHGLGSLYRAGHDDGRIIELYDQARAIVRRKTIPLKERLLALDPVLREAKALICGVDQ